MAADERDILLSSFVMKHDSEMLPAVDLFLNTSFDTLIIFTSQSC